MSAPRLLLSLVLVICGFAAGLVITGRTPDANDGPQGNAAQNTDSQSAATRSTASQGTGTQSTSAQSLAPQGTAPPAVTSPLPGVATTLPDFSRVAQQTVPAVANISSLQVVRRQNSPFANDPFFQFFYGNRDDVFGSRRSVERSLGSGVIVSADGLVLTNNHVVAGESGRLSRRQLPAVSVALGDNREVEARIVGVDPATDLALLKIDADGLPTIPWGDSDQLKVAEWVLAIGNPFQLNQTVTLGIVSALGRTNVGIAAYEDFIQTDAAINPGNSGGALVNTRGELVGINTAIFSQSGGYQGIGFAVPSNLARRVVDDLNQYGEVRRGVDRVRRNRPAVDACHRPARRPRRKGRSHPGHAPQRLRLRGGAASRRRDRHLQRLRRRRRRPALTPDPGCADRKHGDGYGHPFGTAARTGHSDSKQRPVETAHRTRGVRKPHAPPA